MIQEGNININSANIKQWMIYLEEAERIECFRQRELRKRGNLWHEYCSNHQGLHKENEIIEKAELTNTRTVIRIPLN